jgi:uracil-DNA glycosylase
MSEPAALVGWRALGATAAKALLGPKFRITQDRGRVLDHDGLPTVATTHPSAILRTPPEDRAEALAALVRDLEVLARLRPGSRAQVR